MERYIYLQIYFVFEKHLKIPLRYEANLKETEFCLDA